MFQDADEDSIVYLNFLCVVFFSPHKVLVEILDHRT